MLMKTRPNRLPDPLGPSDLLLRTVPATVWTLILCGIGALCLSLTLVLGPIAIVVAYTPVTVPSGWVLFAGAVGWAGLWLALFVAATREDAEIQRWLADQ